MKWTVVLDLMAHYTMNIYTAVRVYYVPLSELVPGQWLPTIHRKDRRLEPDRRAAGMWG